MRDFKKFTSKAMISTIKDNQQESRKTWLLSMFEQTGRDNPNNQRYQFWQQHNKPIVLNNASIFEEKLNYLHKNPVWAGYVDNEIDYPYSSARDYSGEKGLVMVELPF